MSAVNPKRFAQVVKCVREMTEAQEIIRMHDPLKPFINERGDVAGGKA